MRRRLLCLCVLFGYLQGCQREATPPPKDFPAGLVPRTESLVSASWVKKLIDYQSTKNEAKRPPTFRNSRFVILEVGWGKGSAAKDYGKGHLPGAVYLDTDALEDAYPTWRLRSPSDLQTVLGNVGITADTTVVVYGGQLIAVARVWWVLKYMGVTDVRLLDGGAKSWKASGYPLEKTVREVKQVSFNANVRTEMLATTEEVRSRQEAGTAWLGDVRSEAEFVGRKSGYHYLKAKGRIPGALPLLDADSQAYQQRDGRLRRPDDVLEMWQRQGLLASSTPERFDREVIFYCGGGWRSSLAYFYAWLLGYENIRNYSDGWAGWSTDYLPDASAKESTPGWRQQATANPVDPGD